MAYDVGRMGQEPMEKQEYGGGPVESGSSLSHGVAGVHMDGSHQALVSAVLRGHPEEGCCAGLSRQCPGLSSSIIAAVLSQLHAAFFGTLLKL